jgi:hypothetical protein
MRRIAFSAIAAIALGGCATSTVRIAGEGEDTRAKPLPYREISRFLESRHHAPVYAIGFQRDSLGSTLFINYYFRDGNAPAYRTLILTGEGIREIPGYPRVWYDDQAQPAIRVEGNEEWYEGEGQSSKFFSQSDVANYVFKNGAVVPYKAVSGVRGFVGGDFIVIRFRDKPGCIVSSPEEPLQPLIELPEDVEPEAAYASGDSLIMFDTCRPQEGGEFEFVRRCLVYQKSADTYRLVEEIPIPWAVEVCDLNTESMDALIVALNKRHKYPAYYRFNIKSRRRALVGVVPADDVLFLKVDVIRKLDVAIAQSK